MDQHYLDAVIETLENIREQPSGWVGTELKAIVPFLNGFNTACRSLGFECGYDPAYRRAAVDRGWTWSASGGAEPAMREHGLDDEAITYELLTIEIDAWKRRGNITPE